MLLEELQKNKIEAIQTTISGEQVEVQALLVQLRRDVSTLQDGIDALRTQSAEQAADMFFDLYDPSSDHEIECGSTLCEDGFVASFQEVAVFGTSIRGTDTPRTGYFYPLFLSPESANNKDTLAGGPGTSHEHEFAEYPGTIFYMPTSIINHGQSSFDPLQYKLFGANKKEEFFLFNELFEGFEESEDGEKIISETFHFEKLSEGTCEQLVFEKVFFLFVGSATAAAQVPDGEQRPELFGLFGSRFVEICDLPKSRKKGAFIQQYFKTFSYFLQRPRKNHVVKGIKFRKFARKKKITKILDQVRDIVNDPGNVGGPKKKKENIKITFGRLPTSEMPASAHGVIDRTFDFISAIELVNTSTGEERIVFVNTLQDVRNKTYPLFGDRRANFYVSELAGLYNRTLANTLIGKTNYLEASEMFLAPGMTIERNDCASNATSAAFGRDAGAIILDALQDTARGSATPSRELEELAAIYESGPIKSLELVERENRLLKDSKYLEVVGRALRETSIEGGQSIKREFQEFFAEINPRQNAQDIVDQVVAQSRKVTWQQLLAIAAASAASKYGIDDVLDEDYVRRLTIKAISSKFNDNQTLKAIFLTIPPAKLKELAVEFGFIEINSEPQIIRPIPLMDTVLSNTEDALTQAQDVERRQWLTQEQRGERRNIRQDQELSELRAAAQINAFLLFEAGGSGSSFHAGIDPETGREIGELSKAELRSVLRRQRRQLEEYEEPLRALIREAEREADQHTRHMERAGAQLEREINREERHMERAGAQRERLERQRARAERKADRILGRQIQRQQRQASREEMRDARQYARDVIEAMADFGISTPRSVSAADGPGTDLDSNIRSRYQQFRHRRGRPTSDNNTTAGTPTSGTDSGHAPWYATNRDEYEINKRYYESVISGALDEEQRELLTEVIIYALNCNTQEGGNQLEKILEFVIFDLGVDNTVIGDILGYFEKWSKWINTWDINNIDFCQMPVVSIPGDGSTRIGIEFNFPPRIRLPHLNLLDIFRFIFEAILKAIFTALLYVLKKVIQFLLALIPDITFDFDICKMGNFLNDFKDALRNTICNKINGVGGQGLTAEELLCYEPFGGAQAAALVGTTAASGPRMRHAASRVMDFVGASCSGLLPAEDFFDFLNGNLTETTRSRAAVFFSDDPEIAEQIKEDPDSLATVGSAIGQIIDIGEIEASLLAFEPLLGTGVDELCQDPDVEDLFNNLCAEDNPALVQQLKEILDNNRRQQLEDSLKIIGYLSDPESLASEIEDSIPNLMHPSNIIPQLVKDNQIISIEVKDSPKFAVGRDQEELGTMNLNIINTNLNLMANSNNVLGGGIADNAREYIKRQEKGLLASVFSTAPPPTGSDGEGLITDSLSDTVDAFGTAVRAHNKFISNTSFSYDKAALINDTTQNFFSTLQERSAETSNFEVAKRFINQQLTENYNEEVGFITKPSYEDLLGSVLAKVSVSTKLVRSPEATNIKTLINPKRSRKPGSFLDFAGALSLSALGSISPDLGIGVKFDIFPSKRKGAIIDNYLDGDFKQEKTYRRFIEKTREYSKVLLSLSDAELIATEEAFVTTIEAVILAELPALLAYANTEASDGDTSSLVDPFCVNDIVYKYYGGSYVETVKSRINALLDEKFFVVQKERRGEPIRLSASGLMGYVLYEISKIKSDRFLSTYGRIMLPTDAFCAAVNKALANLSQTFNSSLSASQLDQRSSVSHVINNSNLIVPFEAPSAFSNELNQESFRRLQEFSPASSADPFLASTALFELAIKSESNVQNVVDEIATNPLFNSFFSIESGQRPLILDFLRGGSSLRFRGTDVFDRRTGTMAFLASLYAQADTAAETLSVEDFLFANFNIRLVYEIYAAHTTSVAIPGDQTLTIPQIRALTGNERKIFSTESGHLYLLPPAEIGDEENLEIVSLVRIISHQSSFLSKGDLSLSQIYENIHNNFINKFMSTNSPDGIIKSELAQNPELITFFQLCFPFSDIINAVTIYFSRKFKRKDRAEHEGIISRAPTSYIRTNKDLLERYLNVINK